MTRRNALGRATLDLVGGCGSPIAIVFDGRLEPTYFK
jgi:hypothetical protein